MEKVTGKSWKVDSIDLPAKAADAKARLARGDFSGIPTLLQDVIFDSAAGTNWDARGITSNELLQLPKQDLETTIRALVK